ncbi:MAG TPA: serine/threonine-protein kinase [Thermoleophilaceae bacterium]
MAVQANGTLLAERYRVIRRLGSGGAATVFLCEDERLGRKVAVKRMHAHSPEDIQARLRREARLGASLSHPNLVSVFDTETYEEGVFIVMEYVEGETLADALVRGPLDGARTIAVLRGVASALDNVHAQGIVHRDVKPANVLLGSDGSVKLADLGVGLATDVTRITQSGQVLGTPAYMSPEQIDGATPTAATDIYALGALAYEMLSGEKARKGSTPLEVAHRVTSEPPPDLRRAWPAAPPGAAAAIKEAMSRDPGRRPASAGELVDELSRALAHEPTPTPTAATTPLDRIAALGPASRRRRRVPSWVPLLGLLAVAAAVALVLVLGGGGGSSNSSSGSKSSAKKKASHHHAAKQKTTAASTITPAAAGQPQTQQQSTPPATTDPIDLNNEGKSLIDSGRAAAAIPILQKALAAFPADQRSSLDYGFTLFNLGDAYVKTGQPQKAIPYLQQRLRWNNQRGVVLQELREAMQQAGVGAGNGGFPGKDKHKGHGGGDHGQGGDG